MEIIEAKVYKCGDNIDTDRIIPARYLNTINQEELAKHCLEGIEKDFYKKIKQDYKEVIIVGGINFGCGSSREHAVVALRGCGVVAILAKSFARIFLRNAINRGLPVIEFNQTDEIQVGDVLKINLVEGIIINKTSSLEYKISPYPEFLQKIIKAGGILNYLIQTLKNN